MIFRLQTTRDFGNGLRNSSYPTVRIVRAKSKLEARQMAAAAELPEFSQAWLDESTTVETLGTTGISEILG